MVTINYHNLSDFCSAGNRKWSWLSVLPNFTLALCEGNVSWFQNTCWSLVSLICYNMLHGSLCRTTLQILYHMLHGSLCENYTFNNNYLPVQTKCLNFGLYNAFGWFAWVHCWWGETEIFTVGNRVVDNFSDVSNCLSFQTEAFMGFKGLLSMHDTRKFAAAARRALC
jgi:hypothetical protein